jgi:urease accessory protein
VIGTHQDGLLELQLGCDRAGRTHIVSRQQRFPLRITVPLYLDPGDPGLAFLYVQNPTGGVAAGDHLNLSVTTEPGARAHLTTQAATKIYRMDGGEARQDLRFDLAADSYLEYLPDPVIPHAGARLTQQMTVDLGEGAAFVAAEILGPGRLGREHFDYSGLTLRTEVRRCGEPVCVDAMEFAPARASLARHGLYGSWNYLATVLVVTPEPGCEQLESRIEAELPPQDGVVGAVGALPHRAGVIVRILANAGPAVRHALHRAVSTSRNEIIGCPLPPLRK